MSEDVRVKLRGNTLWLEEVGKQTPESLDFAFNDENEKIDKIREKLAMLIAGNPKDLMSKYDEEECGSVTGFIEQKINDVLGDAQDAYCRLERLSILERILDEWNTDPIFDDDVHFVFGNVDFKDNEQIGAFVYPEQRFDEATNKQTTDVEFYGKPHANNTFKEIYDAGKRNIAMNDKMSEVLSNKWMIFVDDTLFVTYDGQFVFGSRNDAIKAVKDQMNQRFTNRCSYSYFQSEPENAKKFFDDVKAYSGEDEFIDKCIEQMKKDKAFYITSDAAKLFNVMNDAFDKYLQSHIKCFKVSELTK